MIDTSISKIANKLFTLANEKKIDNLALSRALEIIHYNPPKNEWKKFIDFSFLFLGIGFLLAGIIFFFAYNWISLNNYVKFAVIEIGLIFSILLVLFKKVTTNMGKASLISAIILTGVLLATFGQIYQTGADSYQLFASWSLLIVGWVVMSNFLPIWTILVVLINTSIILYWNQILSSRFDSDIISLSLVLIITNSIFLTLFEYLQSKSCKWINGRWFPRLLITTVSIFFNILMINVIFETNTSASNIIFIALSPIAFFIFLIVIFTYYLTQKKDLFFLTVALLSWITVFTSFIGNIFVRGFEGFILLSFIIILQCAGSVMWLKKLQSKWDGENKSYE